MYIYTYTFKNLRLIYTRTIDIYICKRMCHKWESVVYIFLYLYTDIYIYMFIYTYIHIDTYIY